MDFTRQMRTASADWAERIERNIVLSQKLLNHIEPYHTVGEEYSHAKP